MNLRKTAAIIATVALTASASALSMYLCSLPIDSRGVSYTREGLMLEAIVNGEDAQAYEFGEIPYRKYQASPNTYGLFNYSSATPRRDWGGSWPSGFI